MGPIAGLRTIPSIVKLYGTGAATRLITSNMCITVAGPRGILTRLLCKNACPQTALSPI